MLSARYNLLPLRFHRFSSVEKRTVRRSPGIVKYRQMLQELQTLMKMIAASAIISFILSK
jgi:hypothetical protein